MKLWRQSKACVTAVLGCGGKATWSATRTGAICIRILRNASSSIIAYAISAHLASCFALFFAVPLLQLLAALLDEGFALLQGFMRHFVQTCTMLFLYVCRTNQAAPNFDELQVIALMCRSCPCLGCSNLGRIVQARTSDDACKFCMASVAASSSVAFASRSAKLCSCCS